MTDKDDSEDSLRLERDAKFQEKLKMGIDAENIAYNYLKANNSYVEDLRQQKHGEFAGPCLCGTEGKVVNPDFIVYNKNPNKGTYAVDVKSKNKTYPINGKICFTVDDKFEQYKKSVEIKRLDYLAILFFLDGRMYMYKDSDCAGMHQYPPSQYGNGRVYYFEFDKRKMVY
jgi:hypothetical protein